MSKYFFFISYHSPTRAACAYACEAAKLAQLSCCLVPQRHGRERGTARARRARARSGVRARKHTLTQYGPLRPRPAGAHSARRPVYRRRSNAALSPARHTTLIPRHRTSRTSSHTLKHTSHTMRAYHGDMRIPCAQLLRRFARRHISSSHCLRVHFLGRDWTRLTDTPCPALSRPSAALARLTACSKPYSSVEHRHTLSRERSAHQRALRE